MLDLKTEIRDYYNSAADPVTAAEVMAGTGRLMDVPERPLRHRPTLAFVGAALTLVVAVGLAAVLLLPGDSDIAGELQPADTLPEVSPTTVQAATPTTAVTPTTEQVPTTLAAPVVQEPMTWTRMPFDGRVSAVANGGSGLIAAGTSDGSAALWQSPDGMTWTRIPLDESVFGGYEIMRMVATSDGYAAIGGDGATELVAWTSPDGVTWQRTPIEGIDPEEIERLDLQAMTAGPSGLVAVGWTFTRPEEPWMLDDHFVIHSPDGTVWQRADTSDLPLGGMWDVAAGGPGYVAVGVDWSQGVGTPGVWTSPDGLTWTLFGRANIERPDIPYGTAYGMESLTASDDGKLYAFGEGTVWTSDDGTNWSVVEMFAGEPEEEFASVWGTSSNVAVAFGDRVVLAGGLGFRNLPRPDRAAVWASDDGGITWERMSRPLDVFGNTGESEMHTLTEIDGTYVAFGICEDNAAVWVGSWNEEDGS